MENLRNIAKNLKLNTKESIDSQKDDARKAIEDFSSAFNAMDPKEIRDNFNEIRPWVFKARGMKKILIESGLYKEEDINLDTSLYEAIQTKIKISNI